MGKITKFLMAAAVLVVLSSQSNFAQSNLTYFQVMVNITLSTGFVPVDVEVQLNNSIPVFTDSSGVIIFDSLSGGPFYLTAFKIGYDTYVINHTFINSDKVFNIVLSEKKYPPTCLLVDSLSLEATWCEPLITALDEDFENPVFPPAGWQTMSHGEGWYRTNDGNSGNWTIPDWNSYYAMTNSYPYGNGCCDYLITPAVDLRESEGYSLSFDSFYDGGFGDLAFVEYSLDGGDTWEILCQINPAQEWTAREINLDAFSGPDGPEQILFAFHADDAGGWGTGWAVDNVKIQVPAPAANYLDFWVFLDDSLVGVTTDTNWNYAPLLYGTTHTASVAARYTSGLSNKDYYTFFCKYLFPPDSLTGIAPDDAAILDWTPPLEPWPAKVSGMSYEEYLNENNLQNIRSSDAPSAARAPRANINLPGMNPFDGIRDLNSKAWVCEVLALNIDTFMPGTPGTLNYLGPGAGDLITAADIVNGSYYGTISGGTFVMMDTATGAFTTIGSTADLTGMAYDYTTWTMFGVDFGGTLYTIDLETGAATVIGNSGGVLIDCACDNDGILYAVDIGSDVFGSIDKTTAAFTAISALPFDANYAQGMQCEHSSNVVYYAAYNNSLGAGQLYAVEQETGTYTLIGNFQGNVEVDGMAMPGGTVPAHLPENLLGYNIYRNGGFLAYKPHEPAGEYVPQWYVDEDLWPGIYEYTVTAVYDLAPYGYPGDTGESMPEGPATVSGGSPFDLDFLETWSMGTFDDNLWLAESANWLVNTQLGNPSPSAEFSGDPVITNYQASLTSYPVSALGMTEGKIWFDFDLKLDAVEPTGEERIQAEIWNWDNSIWTTLAAYSNAGGSFDWTSEHVNIKAYALNQIFQIRFRAIGSNSASILGWFIDNIHVYRECDGPVNLTTYAVADLGIYFSWEMPGGGSVDDWIQWDDGVYSGSSVGTNGPDSWDVAARWEPYQLVDYDGASVTQVSFVPVEPTTIYNVRVWIGAGAENLIVDQVVTPVCGVWNTVTLTTPVPVDVTQELWIGYQVINTTGLPAGVDIGPAIDGYGNMINYGGWQTLLQIDPDLNCNWNIAAHLVTAAGISVPLGKGDVTYNTISDLNLVSIPNQILPQQVYDNGRGSRELAGFNIYRNVGGSGYQLWWDNWNGGQTLVDPAEGLIPGTMYCYMVTAVFYSETDQCESAFSNESCVLWTGIGDKEMTINSLNLYPNPANDHACIYSSADLKRITVFEAMGRVIKDEILQGNEYELYTSSFNTGLYLVRVESAAGIFSRTLTIQR